MDFNWKHKVAEYQEFQNSISWFDLKDENGKCKGKIKVGIQVQREDMNSMGNLQYQVPQNQLEALLKPKIPLNHHEEISLQDLEISEMEEKVYGNNVFSTFDQGNFPSFCASNFFKID